MPKHIHEKRLIKMRPETSDHYQQLNDILKELSLEQQVLLIRDYFDNKPELRDALAVRLCDKGTTMYGKTIVDEVTSESKAGQTRYSLQVHPYVWKPSGASVIPVWHDDNNMPYIALVYNRRKDRRSDKEKNIQPIDMWRLPEGFMHPKPCTGSDNIALIYPDIMDEAEELILNEKMDPIAAYTSAIKLHRDLYFKSHGNNYDNNLIDCAKREVLEEIGLDLSQVPLKEVGSSSSSVIHHWYLAELNKKLSPYTNSLPKLKVDGIEIGEAKWFSLKDFKFEIQENDLQIYVDKIKIPMKYALMIGQALYKSSDLQTESSPNKLFPKRKSFNRQLKFFQYRDSNQVHHNDIGHNPAKAFRINMGLDKDEIEKIKNLPGNTPHEKLKNWKYLSQLQEYTYQYQKRILDKIEGVISMKSFSSPFLQL